MPSWPPGKNKAFTLYAPLLDADGDPTAGATGLSSTLIQDGGAGVAGPVPVDEGSGVYSVALTAAQMNFDAIVAVIVATGPAGIKNTVVTLYTVAAQFDDLVRATTPANTLDVNATGGAEVGSFQAGAITAAAFAAGAIDAAAIGTGAIDADAIAADAITAAKIAANAIDAASLAADTGFKPLRTGTAAAGAAGTITLDAGASATDDFYNDTVVVTTGGTGAGQARAIQDYIGATKVATVTPSWVTAPDATTTFAILPGSRVDVATWAGALVNALIAGRVDANAQVVGDKTGYTASVGAGGITATSFAAGAIDAAAIATDAIGAAEFAQAAADKVWSSATRTLTSLGAALVQEIWDRATSLLTTVGSIGKLLVDNVNAAVSSRAVPGDAMALTAAAVNAVWDEATAEARVAGSYGQLVKDDLNATVSSRAVPGDLMGIVAGGITSAKFAAGAIDAAAIGTAAIDADAIAADAITAAKIAAGAIDAATFAAGAIDAAAIGTGAIDADALAADASEEILKGASGTADSGTTTTMVDAERTEAGTDFWKDMLVLFSSGPNAGLARRVSAFDPATDTVTFGVALPNAVAVGHTYLILRSAIQEAAGAGATDWSAAERNQIRDALGVDGTKVAATAGQLQTVRTKTDQLTFTIANKVDASIQAAGDFAQAAADKVWSSATRTLTAFSTALAVSVWDVLEAAVAVASSIGLKVKNNLDAAVTTRAAPGAEMGILVADEDAIVDKVWDEAAAGHVAAGTFGARVDAAVTTRAAPGDILTTPANKLATDASGRVTVGALAAAVIDAASVAAAAANKVADHLIRRTFTNARTSADGDAVGFRSLLGAVAKLVNKVSISGTTLTVTQEDDLTALGTQAITTDANQQPITGLDTT